MHSLLPCVSGTCSNLEATRLAAATGLLELPAFRTHAGRRGRVGHARRLAEEALGLAGLHAAAQEDGALAHWGAQSQLVESDALTAGFHNSCSRSLGEAQGTDGQLGHIEEALVICDGAYHTGNLSILVLHVLRKLGQGYRDFVASGHVQPLEDHLVEFGVCAASHEFVELAEETEVWVLGLHQALVGLGAASLLNVNTHWC